MQIPGRLEQEISGAVASHLETELARRCLLLASDEVAAADADAARLGARLLPAIVELCYPHAGNDAPLVVAFDSERTADRLRAALAFGALTANVLSGRTSDGTGPPEAIELLSAVFNVGIGLVDGLCDEDPAVGRQLLKLLSGPDLVMAAERKPERHWLRARLPSQLARDATVAFTVDIIEAFFAALHVAHPREAGSSVRRAVAANLTRALQAERVSAGLSSSDTRERLLECSRLTSVLPFEIIETLVQADDRRGTPTPGTLLGEALWRIDDLVDVCDDARSGALNSLLVGAARAPWRPDDERTVLGSLERLLSSTDIAGAAEAAAESMLLGLGTGGRRRAGQERPRETLAFLGFIQEYAGISPRVAS
jgi:hypothetical protein